ncbi:BN860_15214g1_1 [Zygosaccharomyces bailii CLIB 213]|uniref:Phosphatidylserine decarboxylase proenzyme 1, mitochondrial n=1 Tax=Zygosaccharomyces bailii (strain CLIB 213 / ATCC 58445 / CBS 680 / BCRC 21525 / NBRC 1098 / NCYC 1416 / NRRL Y-2227) TaxID=1333698 RepID=A0A8J2T5J6_ZYGB2|nr:BN860_15214g1_1 [Zygosaccharomyces bailii CLIB 213]
MIPVKSALSHGRTVIMMPMGRLVTKIQFRNRTAILWNRRFSSRDIISQKHRSNDFAKNTHAEGSARVQTSMIKCAVLTSVTIVLGTILLKSQHEGKKLEDEEEDKTHRKRQRIKIFDNNWLFFCYSTLPLNAISRLWGQFNSINLPVWLRPWGYKCYSYLFGVNLDEMADPDLSHYANLSEFFYREIKPECRPIAQGANVIACPSDGKVLQLGVIDSERGEIEQVKGLTYSIKDFLGTHSHPGMSRSSSTFDLSLQEEKHKEFAKLNNIRMGESDAECAITIKNEGDKALEQSSPPLNKTVKLLSELSLTTGPYQNSFAEPTDTELYYAVIYLAPGDYHHFHSPVDWVCQIRRHFPGDLFSVAPYFQHNFPDLFVLNERVATLGHWTHGFFSMTAVGATNVGSIKLSFDKELVTNIKRNKHTEPYTCYEATYENASKILGGMPLIKGEEMGGFMLGSTVVLCFEAPKHFKFHIKVGDKVQMGQQLGAPEK